MENSQLAEIGKALMKGTKEEFRIAKAKLQAQEMTISRPARIDEKMALALNAYCESEGLEERYATEHHG